MQTAVDFIGFLSVLFLARLRREKRCGAAVRSMIAGLAETRAAFPAILMIASAAWLAGKPEELLAKVSELLPLLTCAGAMLLALEVLLASRLPNTAFFAQWLVGMLVLALAVSPADGVEIIGHLIFAYAVTFITLLMLQSKDPQGLDDWFARHPGIGRCFLVEAAIASPPGGERHDRRP